MTLTNISKPVLAFLFSIFLFQAKAEYNGYHLSFTITTTDGTRLKAYNYTAAAYFDLDSVNSMEYLMGKLSTPGFVHPFNDSIQFYSDRLMYEYQVMNDTTRYRIYTVLNPTEIPRNLVKSITVDEVISQTYMTNIANTLRVEDTAWMYTAAQSTSYITGYLCFYVISVHSHSSITDNVLQELYQKEKDYKARLEKMEKELEYLYGQQQEAKEEQIEKLSESIDETLSEELLKLEGEKVVIIGTCTC